ncbi:Uncharacterised protein [uncultured archaeon]|nr:Uncharacterised protein [uncultured archaeon]
MTDEESCPNCGRNSLDIDAQNSVVYCKNCGFAARVNPQTGEVTTLNPGSQGGGSPAVYNSSTGSSSEGHSILGLDPLIFFLLGITAVLSLMAINVITDPIIGSLFIAIIVVVWWIKK